MTAFDQVASAYDSTPNPLLALEERFLSPLLPSFDRRTVADIGAGTGRWTRRFPAARTIAIDTSPAMLSQARGARVIADARNIPMRDASVDVVFCTFTLGYAPSCFSELVRIARHTLIVTDVHPSRNWSRMAPSFPYSLADLSHPSLTQTHFIEPHLGEPERPLFAAKPQLYEPACKHPAIFIAIWTKR